MGEGEKRPSTARRVVLYGLLAVAVLGLGAAGVAFRAYDKATQIDRSHPEVVLDNFVDFTFNRRDAAKAQLYACAQPQPQPIQDLLTTITSDEQKLGVTTRVTLGPMEVIGDVITAELQIRSERDGAATKKLEHWRFTMVEDDGWRVCGAERISDPLPTPSASYTATPPTTPSPQ
jgi:hypothetical protein